MTEMNELEALEAGVVSVLASSYGEPTAAESEPFDFDADFQTKIAALALRDVEFARKTHHLIRPEYFENIGEASLVGIAMEFYRLYQTLPDAATCVQLIKERKERKLLKGEAYNAVRDSFKGLYSIGLAGGSYVAEKVAEFCRNKATENALLQSVELLNKRDFDKINKVLKEATSIGINEDGDEYDYFERIEERTTERKDIAAGKVKPRGISTGYPRLDDLLYHKGWGLKELTLLMGGAKSGKTTALINFSRCATLAGKNVLYVTLEVAANIIAERLDASITDVEMREIGKNIINIQTKIESIKARSGKLKIHELPSGSMTPNMLRQIIQKHKDKGLIFDMIVVDYADLMRPEYRTNDSIENSKSIYTDLRAIATEENVAVLTATQTNRDGFKATVAKAEHVADDFNKIRIADLTISINVTEEERAAGEARLYFAASRNQEGGFSVVIKQDLQKMKFITSILRIE